MTLNNKRAVSSGKVTSVATVSSNRDEAMSTSYHSENAVVTDSNESTKGNLPSDANSCAVKDTSNVIPVRKSGRRRSYTSLLMTISKVNANLPFLKFPYPPTPPHQLSSPQFSSLKLRFRTHEIVSK